MRIVAGLRSLLQGAGLRIKSVAAASSAACGVQSAQIRPTSLVSIQWSSQRVSCRQQRASHAVQRAHTTDVPSLSPSGLPACVAKLSDSFVARPKLVTAAAASAATAARRRSVGAMLRRQCNVAVRQRGYSAVVEPSSARGISSEAGSVASPVHCPGVSMQDSLTMRQRYCSAGACLLCAILGPSGVMAAPHPLSRDGLTTLTRKLTPTLA